MFIAIASASTGDAFRWPPNFATLLMIASLYVFAIALTITWTLGLAWHVVACSLNWRSLAAYFAFGFSAGALLGLSTMMASSSTLSIMAAVTVFWFASTGAVVAVLGWLIRRPDRDASPNPPTSPP